MTPKVKMGIDVLRESGFAQLAGKRVALVVNPASVDSRLVATVDVFMEASRKPGVGGGPKVVALLGPEHGVYGDEGAGDEVPDKQDARTGVTAFSLYGKTRVPTTQMVKNVDAVVFDLQDLGARSYTYVTTLRNVLKGCAQHDVELVILDRPNPLGGNRVEGGMVMPGFESGVSYIPTPYVHGMTMGELVYLLRDTYQPKFDKIRVIKMEGWKREMVWPDTGLGWTPTSPGVPQAESVPAYVSTGILGELYAVSIGIGTTLPFQYVGTPTPGQALPPVEKYEPPELPGIPPLVKDGSRAMTPEEEAEDLRKFRETEAKNEAKRAENYRRELAGLPPLPEPATKPAAKKKPIPFPPGLPEKVPSPFFVPADTLADVMNAQYKPGCGVYFQPARWVPHAGNLKDLYCQGVQVRIDPHTQENLVEINFRLMKALNGKGLLEAAPKRHLMFDKVTGSPAMRTSMSENGDLDAMFAEWRKESEAFRESRKKYLMY